MSLFLSHTVSISATKVIVPVLFRRGKGQIHEMFFTQSRSSEMEREQWNGDKGIGFQDRKA